MWSTIRLIASAEPPGAAHFVPLMRQSPGFRAEAQVVETCGEQVMATRRATVAVSRTYTVCVVEPSSPARS